MPLAVDPDAVSDTAARLPVADALDAEAASNSIHDTSILILDAAPVAADSETDVRLPVAVALVPAESKKN